MHVLPNNRCNCNARTIGMAASLITHLLRIFDCSGDETRATITQVKKGKKQAVSEPSFGTLDQFFRPPLGPWQEPMEDTYPIRMVFR